MDYNNFIQPAMWAGAVVVVVRNAHGGVDWKIAQLTAQPSP